MADDDLECLIRYYFFRGFEYVQIFNFLARYHGKVISERTLHTVWKTERIRVEQKNTILRHD